jgi:hypothetical protein
MEQGRQRNMTGKYREVLFGFYTGNMSSKCALDGKSLFALYFIYLYRILNPRNLVRPCHSKASQFYSLMHACRLLFHMEELDLSFFLFR